MDMLVALLLITVMSGLFAVLGVAASIWGVDSRPGIGDDHAR
jgi:Mg2+ and Co2+ transporter CorA